MMMEEKIKKTKNLISKRKNGYKNVKMDIKT